MPIYEFRCRACGRKSTILTLRVSEQVDAVCEHCGGTALERLMSRFALVRSDDQRLDDLADEASLGDVDESDPKSVARWMRKMGDELGPDAGEDFDELVDDIERGEPDDLEDSADDGDDR
ncbi:MAG TPA: zinc ribbon domain-containing protein [Candidatus Limnocylindria bacterium]|nr:zinc ribbon domain-containing protein [Candidatus Limnocylindria bacterium]